MRAAIAMSLTNILLHALIGANTSLAEQGCENYRCTIAEVLGGVVQRHRNRRMWQTVLFSPATLLAAVVATHRSSVVVEAAPEAVVAAAVTLVALESLS